MSQNMLQLQFFGLCDYLLWQVSKHLLVLYLVAWWEARHSLWSQGSESIEKEASRPAHTWSGHCQGRQWGEAAPCFSLVWWYKEHRFYNEKNLHSHPFPLTGYLILSKSLIDGCHNLDSSFLEVGGYFILFFSSLCPQRWAHWWNILGMQ